LCCVRLFFVISGIVICTWHPLIYKVFVSIQSPCVFVKCFY
jgi:hypothetical protein